MLGRQVIITGLLSLAVGVCGGYLLHPSELVAPDIEDKGTLILASDTFQGYPYFCIDGTDWVIQVTHDGRLWQGHQWQRWSDGALFKITGY